MNTIGNYTYEITESSNTRTTEDGTVLSLSTVTITNNVENKTVRVNDISRAWEREDWLKVTYDAAIKTLEGTPHCCLTGQVEWVNE
jgi:hypothetical protein